MPKGLVLWGVRNIYYVLEQKSSKTYKCLIKGKVINTDFKIKGRRETNPIVVGDKVKFRITDNENGMITERLERKNEFKRLKRKGRVVQTIFSNVDCIMVVDSVANPPVRPYFIDRCLLTAEYMNVPAVIVFNKNDLINEKVLKHYKNITKVYRKLGYEVIESSCITNKGIRKLRSAIKDKIVSFNGRSGVGKSSLIKLLDKRYENIKIGKISKKYDRGIHTTTFAQIYPLKFGGMIIDTPGIRELAIYMDKAEDVEKYIRDFDYYRDKCKFQNCQHINEPDCEVIDAVENCLIEDFRYESYLRMRETIEKIKDSKI